MKEIRNIRFLFIVSLLVFFIACSKSGTTADDSSGDGQHVVSPNDVTAPVIDITSPTTNQVFISGNVINITGRLTDDYGLYRGTIRVTNDANGAVLKEQAYEIHGLKLYDFSLAYSAVVSVVSDYTVTVSFEDHGSNVTTKSVKIKVNP